MMYSFVVNFINAILLLATDAIKRMQEVLAVLIAVRNAFVMFKTSVDALLTVYESFLVCIVTRQLCMVAGSISVNEIQ